MFVFWGIIMQESNDLVVSVKNDYAFKLVFGTEENKDILIEFLKNRYFMKRYRIWCS